MTIQIPPELEALIRTDVERGPYESVDDFVDEAVRATSLAGGMVGK